jgi:hypothetical protein
LPFAFFALPLMAGEKPVKYPLLPLLDTPDLQRLLQQPSSSVSPGRRAQPGCGGRSPL